MASPPKPWETARSGSAAVPTSTPVPTATTTAIDPAAAPAIPTRPDSLNQLATRNASAYSSPLNRASPYSSPYGGMGSSYSSPYSRFGGGGYGGFGGMGGGGMYGSPYGGMGGGYGMGGYGQPGMYGQEQPSMTQSMTQSTQATFQMIESIVGAFGGFAQMLESTYMATHSSFFAMVSVADQFSTLKQTLGSILGIFTVMRWIRTAIAKLTGRPPPASSKELTPANFAAFSGGAPPDGAAAQPKPSRKPFIFFIVAVFGLPYLMSKLIRALAASQEAEQERQLAMSPNGADGQQPLDPSKLDFCKVMYDYTPQQQPGQQFTEGIDLEVKKGDLVAVLSKTDPMGQASDWWRCRARNGQMGYLPSTYLETIARRPQQAQIAAKSNVSSPGHSRVNTMTGSMTSGGSRANSMTITDKEKAQVKAKTPPKVEGKPGDISVESFQRAAFNS
ncbi:Peroxisomal membrane protein PAS20 [Recurvomyces mirabilis]|nr:Peroxisomal membrane protein PAS20 [Recurvomyces mirabilis]